MAVAQIPGGLPGGVATRAITLGSGSDMGGLAWPAKDVRDVLPSVLNVAALLADFGTTMSGPPTITATDPELTLALTSGASPNVMVLVGGGAVGITSAITIMVPLADGGRVAVVIGQEVIDRRAAVIGTAPGAAVLITSAQVASLLADLAASGKVPDAPGLTPGLWLNAGAFTYS